jgi:surface antigen
MKALLKPGLMILVLLAALVTPSTASAATGETSLCHRTDYGCISGSGYSGQTTWGSWGPGHNCVSYTAYRLSRNGAVKPWAGRIGNGNEWDEMARGAGINVDQNPAVGSIAQWDTGSAGHVAYVETVTATYIEISEDAYLTDTSGYSSTRRLERNGSTFAGAEFIHIRDQQPPQPPSDADNDSVIDSQDPCPTVWGPVNNRGCPFDDHSLSGDFTGDGRTDVLTFYNYGNDNLGVFLFRGNTNGVNREQHLWSTGPGQWNWNNSKFVAGQFTADTNLDVLAFYNYGNDDLGVWIFPGNGNGVSGPQFLWRTGAGQWNWHQSQFLAGDFNNDTRTDVLAFYDYGSDNLGAFIFAGTGNGIDRSQGLWTTGNGMWNTSASRYLPGDFNADGRLDVLALYNYGSDNLGVWLFPGAGAGVGQAQHQWNTGQGQWNWNNSKFVTGDYNTDGRPDVLAFYNYGSDELGAFIFPGSAGSITTPQLQWRTGPGQWNWNNSRFLAGQFTPGSQPDVMAFYNYGNDNLGAFIFPGTGNSIDRAHGLWTTGNGMWNWNNM